MGVLEIAAIIVTGFVGCAEFASVALVHPVIRRLPIDHQLTMERGLLTTFGRVMPVGMTTATVLGISLAISRGTPILIAAAIILSIALIVAIIGNVPINISTGRIDQDTAPEGFEAMRRRWDVFQFVRGSLQLIGFVLIVLGVAQSL